MLPVALAIAALAAKAAGSGYKAYSEKKASKKKAKEMKRATKADLLNAMLQNQAELEGANLDSSKRMSQASTRNLMDTASTVRDSFR